MLSFFKPNSTTSFADLALLILRVGMSLLLITHGHDKLYNYLNGARDFPNPIFLGPHLSFLLTIFAEFFCALAVAFGVFTRYASAVLVMHFIVVTFVVHGPDPLGDKEHAMMYLIAYLAVLLTGAGKYSLDRRIG
jgi:putative oxidoreductase